MKAKTASGSNSMRIAKTAQRDRRGTRSSKQPAVATAKPVYDDPSVCEGCASVFTRRTWRRDKPITHALLVRATWTRCPACLQKETGIAYGRVIARGSIDSRRLSAMERRIQNVATRAEFTQPQRTILSMERVGDGLEVLTTSQKLAHRIVNELKKGFGGRARYAWDDNDGSLLATWTA